jgi:hypothetical protein
MERISDTSVKNNYILIVSTLFEDRSIDLKPGEI